MSLFGANTMVIHSKTRVTLTPSDRLPELPAIIKRLYLDVETTSGNPKVKGTEVFCATKVAGIALTWDTHPTCYYLPVRHTARNLPLDKVIRFVKDTIERSQVWVNHNIKIDMHWLTAEGIKMGDREYIDTMTRAKLLNSELRFGGGGYGLDNLALKWLNKDISPWEHEITSVLQQLKSKDYGDCPPDIMGDYATVDVETNRELDQYILSKLEPDMQTIVDIETRLTPVLYDIEQEGLCVDPTELLRTEAKVLMELIKLEEELHNLAGFPIRPQSNVDCRELFIEQLGLPVVGWTKTKNPSFDYAALKAYETLPAVVTNPKINAIITKILAFKDKYTFLNMFVKPYQTLHTDGVIHPIYNQVQVTGRLGCKHPNAQQLSFEARELIHPGEGQAFLSADYSQIEFRIIAHYINCGPIIQAYKDNPMQDFHTWVAEMSEIPRDPAKNVNFATGYGAGEKKILSMLSANPVLHKLVLDELVAAGVEEKDRAEVFQQRMRKKAKYVYDTYHQVLNTLKPTMKHAEQVCKSRGYIRTWYGRRRHLGPQQAWRSFNALCQGTAADIAKEKMIELSPRFNPRIRELGIKQCATVHDETLFRGDKEVMTRPEIIHYIGSTMENISRPMRIPMMVGFGSSAKHWAEAAKINKIDRTAWDLGLEDSDED